MASENPDSMRHDEFVALFVRHEAAVFSFVLAMVRNTLNLVAVQCPHFLCFFLAVCVSQHPTWFSGGAHGYDPAEPLMQGIFTGMGPAFAEAQKDTPTARNVDIYELMCHLLDITPAPNNGTLANLQHLLKPTE